MAGGGQGLNVIEQQQLDGNVRSRNLGDFQGSHFTVAFDGTKVIEADDIRFSDAGKVGVWTKADSVTLFDDFTYSGT